MLIEWIVKEKVSQEWWNCEKTYINRCKIKNWKERSRNTADWEKSIKEAKVRTGLVLYKKKKKKKKKKRTGRKSVT